MNNYVKDRDEALKNLKVKEFIAFLEKHEKEVGTKTVADFKKSNKTVQMATMCKMVVNITTFKGTDTWSKAIDWLMKHEMSGEIQW